MYSHFELLLNALPSVREKVAKLESPNPEDDQMVKFAMVGFCYNQVLSEWGWEEFNFVATRRQEVADFDQKWIEFVCLATGYLLGMRKA